MKSRTWLVAEVVIVLVPTAISHAEIKVVADCNRHQDAVAQFKFASVPAPSRNDAATQATFIIVDGQRDRNGGEPDKLHDGKVPTEEDQPAHNFFFSAGTNGGRLLVDLGSIIPIRQINTYSWHRDTRGPQVYGLYAGDEGAEGFNAQPRRGTDPQTCGWKLLAQVDTRPKEREAGGQYGVGISDTGGIIGKYRYLLFDISRTEAADAFGNTFFSEIDVVDPNTPPVAAEPAIPPVGEVRKETVEAEGGAYQITIETTEAPDLTEWAHQELAPVVREWYPKLVKMLPSEGYEAPKRVSIAFSASMRGVAATGGTRVRCAAGWFRQNLKGEAKGAVVHELVHVVQNYGQARRTNPSAARTPGWLVEGICDYIRWFLYEPQTRGAEVTARNLAQARYDASYRMSGNFLNWVTETCAKDIVAQLNAAARAGRYSEDIWTTATGRTVQELGNEWRQKLEKKVAAEQAAADTSEK